MVYWFTADTHFNHINIIKYTNRPFNNVQEMNDTLIKNWNNRVKDTDTIFILGDFDWKNNNTIKHKLKGNKT